MRKYKGIDIGRVLFACLIPLLHISFEEAGIDIIRQYLSRLGVPYFFVVAGMFLVKSVESKGAVEALKQYALKIGRMLLIWLVIYLPILLLRQEGVTLQEIVFKTPAYLWYLTGLLAASVPFCLVRNRKMLFYASIALYVFGTLFGESYKWLIGGFPAYESIFLTTRNGLFFALPLMCIGEQTWNKEKPELPLLALYGGVLIAEITFVGAHAATVDDRSMYFCLPLFMYEFIILCRQWNPEINTRWFGGISSAIYLMQFGIITVVMRAADYFGLSGNWNNWFAWLMVMIIPVIFYDAFRKTKIIRILF